MPTRSPVGTRRFERPLQSATQLLLQPCRGHVAAARQRTNHNSIARMKVHQHRTGHMSQSTRNSVTFHCCTHGLGDDQPNPGAAVCSAFLGPTDVNDDVGLHGAHPLSDRRVKLSRPPHAVACGQHRWETRRCDQAVNARRPLRRRPVTMALPARVRIRRRKP